jgi:membrane fusion protein, protease secretion system
VNIMQKRSPATDATTVDAVDLSEHADTKKPIRLGLWVLVVGFGLFLLWAALAPLDEGVVAPGAVAIDTKRKTIQHMQGGVIRELRVNEGQDVKAGDVLLVLSDGATRAGFESVQQNYLAQRAAESRLLAELAGAPAITFHPDLLKAQDSEARIHIAAQQQLFAARRAALNAELAAGREAITGLQAQVSGLQGVSASRQAQAALQAEQLRNVSDLARDGFAPRNQALQLEQAQADLRATLADNAAATQRAVQTIAETRQRIAVRQQEYIKEVSRELAEVRREVQANQERLSAATTELERTEIRSPIDGQVIAIAVAGVGGVVTPGQRLMDVVPKEQKLLLDARVPVHVIDRVRVGDATEVRFSGFANTPQLVVDGRVASISGDVVSEQMPGGVMQYYLGRVELTEAGNKALGQRQMHPGMPAEVLIRTGERSMLTYLLHPLTKRVAAAMKEE